MSSSTSFVFVSLILQLGFVISRLIPPQGYEIANTKENEFPPIPLSQLVDELRRESQDVLSLHLGFMGAVASYGDRVYEVSKELSAECFGTLRAEALMAERLAINDRMDAEDEVFDSVVRDLKNSTEFREHPLELVCRKIERNFAEKPDLRTSFEKAKKTTANLENVSGRPPYARKILSSLTLLVFEIIDALAIPEFARLFAYESFFDQLNATKAYSSRIHLLAASSVAVAKKEEFEDSMQAILEKTTTGVISDIAVDDRLEKFFSDDNKGFNWWVPNMAKLFYGYIAKDPILKKEIDGMAAIIGQNASKEDIDFSKL